MKTQSIQEREHPVFPTILATTTAGAATGLIAKHMLPLTNEEMDEEYKETVRLIRTHTNKTKAKYLDEIRNIPNKTLAQDTFVKMIDVTQDEKKSGLEKAFQMKKVLENAKLSESDNAQLRFMMKNINERAKDVTHKYVNAYEKVVKSNRPLAWLMVPGALVGFTIGLTRNILKTES